MSQERIENSTKKDGQNEPSPPTEKGVETKETSETESAKPEKSLGDRLAVLEADRLSAKKQEVDDAIKRLDNKMDEFKRFVANTEVSGRSFQIKEKTEEEKLKEEANALLKGTGLSIE